MPRYDPSFAVHQEFGEIPFDPAAEQAGLFFLQMLEDWVRRVAVDVDLRHQRKADIIGQRKEIRDLVGTARFLSPEPVDGKGQHPDTESRSVRTEREGRR